MATKSSISILCPKTMIMLLSTTPLYYYCFCCCCWLSTLHVFFLAFSSSVIPAAAAAAASLKIPPVSNNKNGFIRKEDLPLDKEWVSFHQTVEFLPADGFQFPSSRRSSKTKINRRNNNKNNKYERLYYQMARKLEDQEEEEEEEKSAAGNYDVYKIQPFVEGLSEYDEYQQAWRLLGFMIDCDDLGDLYTDDDNGNNNNNNGQGSGSWDGGTGEGCQRYVLWAAYVDLEYEGNGIAEYMFWDQKTKSWDDRACKYGGGGSGDQNNNGGEARCAKMDCHLEDTHFSLLGFFKHKVIDDWMEQLFKHEGFCIWTDEEYAFMKNARKGWPQGCSASSTYINGNEERPIYYDIKPTSGGGITIGLYTDPQCVQEYKQKINDSITPENVLGNFLLQEGSGSGDGGDYDFSGYSYSDSMAMWQKSFDIFKICHPCVAYDLQNYGYNTDDDNNRGQNYGKYTYGYDDDYSYQDYQGDDFDCYDDADYTNVNQCMKFMAKTTMNTATFRDLSLASLQGTLVSEPLAAQVDQSAIRAYYRRTGWGTFVTYLWFLASILVLTHGILYYRRVRKEVQFTPNFSYKEPLVFS